MRAPLSRNASIGLPGPGGFVYAVDLGADRVLVYRLNRQWGTLHPTGEPWAAPPGSGPRHLAFDPAGRFAYVLAELKPSITVLRVDATTGYRDAPASGVFGVDLIARFGDGS